MEPTIVEIDGNARKAADVDSSVPWALAALLILSLFLQDTASWRVQGMRTPAQRPAGRVVRSNGTRTPSIPSSALSIRVVDGADAPIANAVVDVWIVHDGRVRAVDRKIVGSTGEALVEDLRVGRYLVVANAPGLSRAVAWVNSSAENTENIRLRLGPEAVLLGSVRQQMRGLSPTPENTTALEQIVVRAMPDGGEDEPEYATRSHADGTFELHGLRPGTWRIEVDDPRFEPVVRRAVSAPARSIALTLRAFSQVNVAVVDSTTRLGVAGVRVSISGSGIWPSRTVETDASGNLVLDRVPSGVYELRAQLGSLVAEPVAPIVLDPGERQSVSMPLSEGAMLEGRVIDAQTHRAVVDARVVIAEDAISSTPRALLSEEDGGFRLQGLLRRSHIVSARAVGYVPRTNVIATPGPGQLAIVAMDREVIVRGRVVDSRRNPVPNAQIEIASLDLDGQSSILNSSARAFRDSLFDRQARTTAQLGPGGELGVTIGAVPRIPTASRPLDLPQGNGPLAATPAAELGGFVTDALGAFQIGEVAPGALRVTASHPAYVRGETALVLARSGATIDVEVMLHEGGVLDGRLVDEGGFPVRQQLIEIRSQREDSVRRVFTANDGTFRVPSLLGEFAVVAVVNGVIAARETVVMEDERPQHVQLQMERSMRTIRGRVLDEQGYPVAGAEIQLQANGVSVRTLAAPDGTFTAVIGTRGALTMNVRHPRFAQRSVPVSSTESDELRVTMNQGATLSIQPLVASCARAGVTLDIHSPCGDEQREIRPGNMLDIPHLCPGTVALLFRAEGCVSARFSANARAGATTEVPRIELFPGGAAEGRVTDANGEIVAGATVSDADDELTQTVRTDRNGHFVADSVREGDRHLIARHPVLGATDPVSVRVLRGTTLRGIELRFSRAE